MCRKCLLSFPSTAGARSARLPTRHSARRAVARSGPAARRPFEIAPRRPAVPPATSWPDLPGLVPGIRPSIRPRTREEAWRREMPGTSPGMTRRVGRSDGSHPQGRRRPQPAPPLHQPFLIPLIPQAPGAHSVRLAYAPFGAARSRALRACGPDSLITNASRGTRRGVDHDRDRAAKRPGRRDCAARRMARRQASGARARR